MFLTLIVTLACSQNEQEGQELPYTLSETRHFNNDGNIRIHSSDITVAPGDQDVRVGR